MASLLDVFKDKGLLNKIFIFRATEDNIYRLVWPCKKEGNVFEITYNAFVPITFEDYKRYPDISLDFIKIFNDVETALIYLNKLNSKFLEHFNKSDRYFTVFDKDLNHTVIVTHKMSDSYFTVFNKDLNHKVIVTHKDNCLFYYNPFLKVFDETLNDESLDSTDAKLFDNPKDAISDCKGENIIFLENV